jgi:hypothetical protein
LTKIIVLISLILEKMIKKSYIGKMKESKKVI